ncbi:MAG: MATE family efflux transporter [Acidobacteria bacterium]|nr:MATE family efflux transporter [Acidobacteriota bacterium]
MGLRVQKEVVETVKLGAPLVAAQLAQISINFVDTLMAGRLSAKDLAAVAIGASGWFLVWTVTIGVLLGITPSVAQLYGAGKHSEIGHCARQGLWMGAAIGISGFFAVRNLLEPVYAWLQVEPAIVPIALGYLDAIAWGLPALCAYQALRSFSEGVSMTKPIMYASILALAGNIIGNYIFMYGHFGAPAMGAVGIGVASAIVMWLMLAFMAAYIHFNPVYRTFGAFSRFEWPRVSEIVKLSRLGVPIAISLFMEGSFFSVAAMIMGSLGTIAVAGHQIAINVASITFMIPLGIAMAISIRVGQAVGRGDHHGARFAGFVGIGIAGAFMATAALLMLTLPEFIAGIYTSDPAVKQMAVTLLFMAAVFQISDGLQVSGAGALRGLKDTRVPMFITTLAYWGIGMPLGYGLGISWRGGPKAIWIGFIFGLAVAAVLLNTRFHLVTRKMEAERS